LSDIDISVCIGNIKHLILIAHLVHLNESCDNIIQIHWMFNPQPLSNLPWRSFSKIIHGTQPCKRRSSV